MGTAVLKLTQVRCVSGGCPGLFEYTLGPCVQLREANMRLRFGSSR